MEQLIPWAIFCSAVLVFCLIKPQAARVFVGVFFILMAIGVNVVLSFAAPDQFVKLGTDNALVPFYAWVFQTFVAPAPQIVGILAAAGETAIGLLILSGGRRAQLGLMGAIIFLIVITPLGVWTLPNPIFAAGLVRLLREEYPRNLLQLRRPEPLPVTRSGHS